MSSARRPLRQRCAAGGTATWTHDRCQVRLQATLAGYRGCPVVVRASSSHREDQSEGQSASVPCPCQNGRKTAVASGQPRAPRRASDLGMGWLTRCVKHTSSSGSDAPTARRCSGDLYPPCWHGDWGRAGGSTPQSAQQTSVARYDTPPIDLIMQFKSVLTEKTREAGYWWSAIALTVTRASTIITVTRSVHRTAP